MAVLAGLNIVALGLGLGAGGLTATIVGLVVGGSLKILGVETGPDIGLVIGIASGLVAGGWVAGTMARHSGRFHGALVGLLLAALITIIARAGGSPAQTWAVIWIYVVAAGISGFAGWLTDRRRARRS